MKNGAAGWLLSVPGRKKMYVVALVLTQAIHGGSGVLYALLLRNVVDAAADKERMLFWRGIVMTVLLVAGQLILRAVIRYLSELTRSEYENIFKARLIDALLRKEYLRISAVHSAEWLNRLTSDTKVVADSCVDILPGLTGMIVKLISALVMIIVLEPRFSAIMIPGGILLIIFTWLFRKVIKSLHKNMQEADGRLRVFMQERIGNMLMIRSYAAEDTTARKLSEKMTEHKGARMKKNRFANLCNIGFGAAMNGMYLLGIGWCGYGILTGTISFGMLTAITQLIAQIQMPFANITGYLPKYYAMLASAERLMEAEEFPEDETDALEMPEVMELYEDLESIGLADTSFTYYPAARGTENLTKDQMPVVVENVSLEVRKGEYVAFTGHSGCGKSTVLKLLMCVYRPDSGVRYYKAKGAGRRELNSSHRRLFAYVPQGNALMSGTIREIVSFADPDAMYDEERLKTALAIACADEFVEQLEDGADTLLGERGTGLSEGQMQRLSIARAIFSGSPVLLLDESTSSLDSDTEKHLLRNLRELTDTTVIIVTHRPAALSICDRVLKFTENGVKEA